MSVINYEEHWKEKCLRYINSMSAPPVPRTPGAAAVPPVPCRPHHQYPTRRPRQPLTARQCLRLFLLNSSAHGLPFAAMTRHRAGVVIWCALILAASIVFLYCTSHFVLRYSQSVPVEVRTVVKRCRYRFPAVTICNNNLIRKRILIGTRFYNLTVVDDIPPTLSLPPIIRNKLYATPKFERLHKLNTFAKYIKSEISHGYLRRLDRLNAMYGNVHDENDWHRIYRTVDAADVTQWRELLRISDLELRTYGHQKSGMIIDCNFNSKPCGPA